MTPQVDQNILVRPVVFDYGVAHLFLQDLLKHLKASKKSFSLRQRVAKVGGCSQSMISQVINGQRQLTRDNLPKVAQVLALTSSEIKFLDSLMLKKLNSNSLDSTDYKKSEDKEPKNHILTDWLNPYVKDLAQLRGFKADPEVLKKMLNGLAPAAKIEKSIQFLLHEGFWRKNVNGQVVPEENYVASTNEIANEKIRHFHKKALQIAHDGVENFTPQQRKASTVLMSINEEHVPELRSLLDSFEDQLMAFIEKYPQGQDAVVQVALHMTPVGERYEK
jgi:uncharacterized protein (TIGR02147 family)